jgi:hypothetical protein
MKKQVVNGITLPCCACKGTVTFQVPESDQDHPTFFHTMPPCERFDQTNTTDDIVKYMRDCAPKPS